MGKSSYLCMARFQITQLHSPRLIFFFYTKALELCLSAFLSTCIFLRTHVQGWKGTDRMTDGTKASSFPLHLQACNFRTFSAPSSVFSISQEPNWLKFKGKQRLNSLQYLMPWDLLLEIPYFLLSRWEFRFHDKQREGVI